MVLQEELKDKGYINLLDDENEKKYAIELEDIFDCEKKPKELLGIYISKHLDELFFLLNGDKRDINCLCDSWDKRIQIFVMINGKSKVITKLKYNIVQLIVFSDDEIDRNRETNLMISRKIMLKANTENLSRIVLDDAEALELPFYMISADTFRADVGKVMKLSEMMPKDNQLRNILTAERKKEQRRKVNGECKKSYKKQDFESVKEWLES